MEAEELKGGPNTRFKLKVVRGVLTTAMGDIHPLGVLRALEQFSEPGWLECGMAPSEGGVLHIVYRRMPS